MGPAFTGPCDLVTCAEAWSLDRAMLNAYSGPLFQLQATAGPNTGSTFDVQQTSSRTPNVAAALTFCGGVVSNCVYRRIYAQIHISGANDGVPDTIMGRNGGDCSPGASNPIYCACHYAINSTSGLPQMDEASASPFGQYCRYFLVADGIAVGLNGYTTSDISTMVVGYFYPAAYQGCCAVLNAAHDGSINYTFGTDFGIINYYGLSGSIYHSCAQAGIYCLTLDTEENTSQAGTTPAGNCYTGNCTTSAAQGNIVGIASWDHTSNVVWGYSNGHDAWSNPWSVPANFCSPGSCPYNPCGGTAQGQCHIHWSGGDMTQEAFRFYEGLFSNNEIHPFNAALTANVTAFYGTYGLAFP